jgi:rRNA small subunit pseudouridine methyltransferase Nep1
MKQEFGCSIVIAEAALELVPRNLRNHQAVRAQAARLGRNPRETFLDRSYHHAAMKTDPSLAKHGRPDIVHLSLAAVMSSPLYVNNKVRVYISTIDSNCIIIGEGIRFPKSYSRFDGLMADLFRNKTIKSREGTEVMLELKEGLAFDQLIDQIIRPRQVIGFSSIGTSSTLEKVVTDTFSSTPVQSCAFVVGGFPRGHFSKTTSGKFTGLYRISNMGLEAHVVVARLTYECEKILCDQEHFTTF